MEFRSQLNPKHLLLGPLVFLILSTTLAGETLSKNFEKQINIKKQESIHLEKQRVEHLKLIKKSKKNEVSVLEKLEYLDGSIRKKQIELDKVLAKIAGVENEITESREYLKEVEQKIKADQKRVDQQIKGMFYLYKVRKLTIFPGYENIKHHFRNQKILQKNTDLDLMTIARLQENQVLKIKKIKQLRKKSKELGALKLAEEEQREVLDFEREQQIVYLKHLEDNQKLRYKYLLEIQQSLEKLNDLIFSLKQEKRYSQRQKKLRGFKRQLNNLPSPAEGKLIHSFGKSKGEALYRLYRRGVLVETPDDQEIVSIMDGKVVFSAPFRGYQHLVIIDHGRRSFSLYGNLEEVFVQENDHINQGEIVGVVAYNSLKKTYLFYFETRYKKRAVDPLRWLKKPYWRKF